MTTATAHNVDVLRGDRPRAKIVTPEPTAEDKRIILELIAADPVHARDREVIVGAILADALAHAGHIDPNRVRPYLSSVYPGCIGATYNALRARKVIAGDGWGRNGDSRSRNLGKPMRLYRWTGLPPALQPTTSTDRI